MNAQDASGSLDRFLEEAVDIVATPSRVWELVGDPRRQTQWSPGLVSCELEDGHHRNRLGSRFVNHNTVLSPEGTPLTWTTHTEVVRFTQDRELAFRVDENWAVWSFTLEALDGGRATRLVERRETPEGISDLAQELTDGFLGGEGPYTRVLRAGMRETLVRIKLAAEA